MDWDRLTLGQALRDSARKYPDRTAIVDDGQRLAFAELDRRVDCLAHGLRELGLGRGDHVAVWMTNCADWVTCWFAAARLGAVLVPINTRYKAEEVEYILRQSEAKALVTMDRYWDIDFLGVVRSMLRDLGSSQPGEMKSDRLPALRSVILWEDVRALGTVSLAQLVERGRGALDAGATLAEAVAADPIIIVYTSGTTGHPKGAMHSHAILRNAANVARVMHVESGDVVLGHMPFYHVAGAITEVSLSMLLGCTLVPVPHWDADKVLDLIERERVNIFGGIPTHFIDCLDSIRRRPRDTSCLKSAWIGGAPVTPDVATAAMHELKLEALQAVYGMTETTASTSMSEFDAPLEIACDNRGRPIGEFEVRISEPNTGEPLPPGIVGEVWVRGHIVMLGYYKNEAATAAVMTPDGWFRTGDLGVFDDAGYLKITGRLKDMFIVGGSNAYPAEIERMIQSHPDVKQAVVVGVPDRRLGEVGCAFVILHEDRQMTAGELQGFCRESMADYKVPRYVHFIDEFPRTETGKIQRYVLSGRARESVVQPA